ncbi:MAG: ribokinase [Thermotogae bacterium]|nr:ribokinase [Thermotogota bacterium]
MRKIFVLGGINADIVLGVSILPTGGQTVKGKTLYINPGGKGANQAVSAARQGANVFMIGKVGKDSFASSALANIKEAGVHTDYVYISDRERTGTALIFVSESGENMIGFYPGATQTLTPQELDIVLNSASPGDIFLSSMEPKPEIVFYSLKKAKELNLMTILNPAPAHPIPSDIYPLLDFITPNETEAKELVGKKFDGIDEALDITEEFHKMGVKHAVITLGETGCAFVSEEYRMRIPSFKVDNVVDTTAAGDAFNGALAAALAVEMDVVDTLRFANAAGALCVTRPGAQNSMPYRKNVEELLKEAKASGHDL